ncbi:autotransporter serine protease [Stenotrophomonas sp. PS02289]|uniref:autotransporter serine protease n=1 Tax=Stenotrophomonas sp. PS02289 TaxID=2991422 RepID=UPI00249C7751|nr:autotransporter serine protease [Stenotrophomonas sp. PS02289]
MKQLAGGRTALAAALAIAVSACSGGSGGENVRVGGGGGTPINTPTYPPVNPPVTPGTGNLPQPAIDAHLALINANDRQGLTGTGVRIGIVDSGVNRAHPTLSGRVVASYSYVDPAANDLAKDDVVGHGTTVASLAAGKAAGSWPGGVAPGAQIVSARIIADKAPTDDGSGDGNEVDGALGLAQVHQDLITNGVKIMNNSWGGLYWTNPSATAAIANEYRPFIFANNGLVVFATGNESKPNPSDMAALPSQPGPNGTLPAADLERGWLAVTAINSSKPDSLSSYANACGMAANYCLAAPGEAVFIDPQSTGSTTPLYYGGGTSYAAPLVSGAAALVWEKYPYLTNDQVRQTLLGTATDLGEPGVDSTFGYGLLNVAAAVKGPARFDWGDFTVNVPRTPTATVWSNDISGAGGLVKQGTGRLVLEGNNTYAGETLIQGGILTLGSRASLTGNVTTGELGGLPNGALEFGAGAPRVTGHVANFGGMYLLAANSTPVIDGNYYQSSQGWLSWALGASPLQVTGKATLDGGELMVMNVVQGYVPKVGPLEFEMQEIMTAQQGVTGRFSRLSYGGRVALLEGFVQYDPTSIWLGITRVSVTQAAASAGFDAITVASANRVEEAFVHLDGDVERVSPEFVEAAGQLQRTQGADALQASLESLSGKAHGLATAMTFDNLDMNRRALSSRFDAVSAAPRLRGAWHSALGEPGQGSFAGNGFQTQGWMMGQDAAIGSNGMVGVAFGETRSSSGRAWSGDSGRDRQSQAQLYAGWNHEGAYALGQIGAGQFTREIDRQLLLGAGMYGVNARYSGNFSNASVESGYRFGGPRASLTPYLGADYARVDSNAFSEAGGFGFGLRSDGSSSQRSQALAGLRAQAQRGDWSFGGYAEWQQILSSDGLGFDASFVGVDAWAPMAGLQPTRSGGVFGVSVSSWLSRQSQLSFGYDQRFGPRGDLRQVGLRYTAAF